MKPNYNLLVKIFYSLNMVNAVHTWKLSHDQFANVASVLYPFLYNQEDMDNTTLEKLFDVGLRKAGVSIKVTDNHLKTFRKVYEGSK